VTLAALRATRGQRLNLHAGGLADPQGRVIALVAASGTGKTTATRSLAQRLGYLSDETVSLDPDGRVYPHPKPLSVLPKAETRRYKQQLSPDDLLLLPAIADGRLARIVVLRRGVPEPRGLVRLGTVEGLLELVGQSSSLSDLEEPFGTLLRLVDHAGGVWALEYDEITDHLETLVDFLAADPSPGGEIDLVRHAGRPAEGPVPDDRVARGAWRDAVEVGDDVLVLLDSRAVHLDSLMATLWLGLTEAQTVDGLVRQARDHHGDHPDAADLVGRALDLLVEEGLVVRGPLA
jgi:hypothetical protein